MPMIQNLPSLAGILIVVCMAPAGMAADLCVQKANATGYLSENPATNCALPQELGSHQFRTDVSKDWAEQPIRHLAGNSAAAIAADRWQLRAEDGTVYAALKRWSVLAGWQISWEIPVDFPVEIEDDATGTYEQAVQRVLTAFRVSDYPPHPCFHENRVVRVVRRIRGNDDECK